MYPGELLYETPIYYDGDGYGCSQSLFWIGVGHTSVSAELCIFFERPADCKTMVGDGTAPVGSRGVFRQRDRRLCALSVEVGALSMRVRGDYFSPAVEYAAVYSISPAPGRMLGLS